MRDGLRLAERIGCNNIEVETDCLEVVTAFLHPLENRIVGFASPRRSQPPPRTPPGEGRAADGGGGSSSSRAGGVGQGPLPFERLELRPDRRGDPGLARRSGGDGRRGGGPGFLDCAAAAVAAWVARRLVRGAQVCGRWRSSSSLRFGVVRRPLLRGIPAAPTVLLGGALSSACCAARPLISARCGGCRSCSRSSLDLWWWRLWRGVGAPGGDGGLADPLRV
ncbi:hypothetical protein QYE76_011581 [Lolium multiflorum]|uniref:Uncharacterized protein n=1 Tax=Lolium multiflorum TaxID=4521 RepID=A0AAD8TZF1_LOLMU|nr:hypothetical protein QYE76_011581 [Lolium multiflorum]